MSPRCSGVSVAERGLDVSALDIAQAAEALGYGNIWLAEHHFSTYGYLARPAQLATYLAAKTTRLRVGTAVIVVPLHHPLVIAEEIATLDLLSGGRADIGLGRGYQHYEFERLGLELDTSRARWEESVDVIARRLTDQSVPASFPASRANPSAIAPARSSVRNRRLRPRANRASRSRTSAQPTSRS